MAAENLLDDIDLNSTPSQIDNEGIQHFFPNEVHGMLPDLNVDGEENYLLDLNALPHSPQLSQSNHVLFDLNQKPFDADVDGESSFTVGEENNANTDVRETNLNNDVEVNETNLEGSIDIVQENFEEEGSQSQNKKLKFLSNEERMAVYHILHQNSFNGRLKKGVIDFVASTFSVSRTTILRIWRCSKESDLHDVSQRKPRNSGRKRIQIDYDRISEIPLRQRTTIRSLACALDTNPTSMFRLLQAGVIRRHSNPMRPLLKEEHKRSRLQFCLSMLEDSSIPHDPIFKSMNNIIHIDEKWFYMSKKSNNYYLLPHEEEPYRTCKSKNFITKVMFLAAIARPRFDSQGNEVFSGKIGIFPFVTQEPAKRTSSNRVAGTLETKAMTSITRNVIRSFLIDQVLPAIKEKWPIEDAKNPIFIQQDNARTHISHDDDEFVKAATQDGFDIRLMCQPANSPDLNVLDLGFFIAIQSLQHKEAPKNIDQLVSAVLKSFEDFSIIKSNFIFVTLQSCMIEIMKISGSMNYKIPNLNKQMLQREQGFLSQLKCDPELVQEVLSYLNTYSS
ncbi:uncharacterized protein LOC130736137 [Lotus japonicus]|uniref:uncharacterized protein LOC130736137 n=1 Tax=Lotus japonicus TaxID=34305 RepID=UPI0025899B24|nr:uncharacterized protein LOC130736137 [Lotus japonicus]